MKIPELYEHKKPVFSLEIFPPKKKGNIESIYDTVEQLAHCNPDFISVTYGAGGNLADNSTCRDRIPHQETVWDRIRSASDLCEFVQRGR